MSKDDYETYCVRLGTRKGKPYAERRPLNVPWHAARGTYEKLSDLALRELINDLAAEARRRGPAAPTTPIYDPFRSQIRNPS